MCCQTIFLRVFNVKKKHEPYACSSARLWHYLIIFYFLATIYLWFLFLNCMPFLHLNNETMKPVLFSSVSALAKVLLFILILTELWYLFILLVKIKDWLFDWDCWGIVIYLMVLSSFLSFFFLFKNFHLCFLLEVYILYVSNRVWKLFSMKLTPVLSLMIYASYL